MTLEKSNSTSRVLWLPHLMPPSFFVAQAELTFGSDVIANLTNGFNYTYLRYNK